MLHVVSLLDRDSMLEVMMSMWSAGDRAGHGMHLMTHAADDQLGNDD